MTTTAGAPPGGSGASDDSHRDVGSGRLVVRFGLGVAELAGAGLASVLRTMHAAGPAPASFEEPSEPGAPLAARHVLIGVFSGAPASLASLFARVAPASTEARRIADRGRRLLLHAPGAARAARSWNRVRARAGSQVTRWAAAGRREEREGLSLASRTVVGLVEAALARVAESPDLKRVIEEQSQGLTAAAVTSLRERSARADNLVEAFARRLLPRARSNGSE